MTLSFFGKSIVESANKNGQRRGLLVEKKNNIKWYFY